jgi:hypothetical protein
MMELEAFNKLTPEEQKEVLAKRVATKKVRCKNWPNCKDPNCIFAHPTETVSNYIIKLFLIFNFNSAHIFQVVLMEINVATFIQIFHANLVIIVQELDVLILILKGLTLVWQCIPI